MSCQYAAVGSLILTNSYSKQIILSLFSFSGSEGFDLGLWNFAYTLNSQKNIVEEKKIGGPPSPHCYICADKRGEYQELSECSEIVGT